MKRWKEELTTAGAALEADDVLEFFIQFDPFVTIKEGWLDELRDVFYDMEYDTSVIDD